MYDKIIKILYVEDDMDHAVLIRELLEEIKNVHYKLTHVQRFDEALLEIDNEDYDIVLLDLSLPDEQGVNTVARVCEQALDIPVVVISGTDDETMAIKALQKGADEYLVKGKVKSHSLSRILRYAIMRHKGRVELQSLSLVDDLTDLYNRKRFHAFRPAAVKSIGKSQAWNDTLFHQTEWPEGDQRQTRSSIRRPGPDRNSQYPQRSLSRLRYCWPPC